MGLVSSMLQSSVRNVEISCEFDSSAVRFNLVPPAPPVIFAGQHFTAYARMPPGAIVSILQHSLSVKVQNTNSFT